ncbi:IS630 family transposase [Nesterenkonia salmonea]|uniref:IS630 family transposase n=1 Tax=Nesterenkonia salmonea TaxID=1804987 RepID=A0A5R9BJW7_9MICC|nr:IS630 family transposase [Nesterenkonia salmonea]TLQ00996.1 IS630 family transposase [Nesterenkonia salmonea]
MARSAAEPLSIDPGNWEVLEKIARSSAAAHRQVQRAKVLLAAAEGVANTVNADRHQVSVNTVRAWRAEYEHRGLEGFGKVKPGRGRKPSIPEEKIAEIIHRTNNTKPEGKTHWSCREMAQEIGVSHSTVQRVWDEVGIKPHRVETFKVSNDPDFEQKLIDVVGLYLNPPQKAMVLCMDEKSSIQALDRTQASLPMVPGRGETMTHDYKRNGTTTLFAALDVLTGKVIGQCLPKHRHTEFLKFLKTIDTEVPQGLDVHLILDNYSTHKHAEVKKWLKRNPRFHLHFTPTSASWLNQVERWFRDLTDKNLRRGVFTSVDELITSIEDYLAAHNQDPKPYTWTATAESILAKTRRARAKLNEVTS